MANEDTKIEKTDTENHPAGVPEGTVLETQEKGKVVEEKIVNDYNEDGEVIGWHKEPL